MAPTAIAMFGEMFRAGIVFAAPVMVFLTIVSAMIGLLARAVPALNVLEIGFTLRVIVALVAMFVFAPLTGPALDSLHQDFLRWLAKFSATLLLVAPRLEYTRMTLRAIRDALAGRSGKLEAR